MAELTNMPIEEEQKRLLGKCREALIWCSGSADFGPGGKAEKGWKKEVQPLLERLKPY